MNAAWPGSAAVLLVAVAAAVASGPPPGLVRLRQLRSSGGRTGAAATTPAQRRGPLASPAARGGSAALIAGASGAILGGYAGLLLGAGLAVATWRWLGRLEPVAVVAARDATARALPVAAELIAAAVAAGTPPAVAVDVVSGAVGGPLGSTLRDAAAAARLGIDPAMAWRELTADPVLLPLARVLTAAVSRGRAPVAVLDRYARDIRDAHRSATEAQARSIGARAALPLGLCFLPAFVLVGVVPVVVAAGPLLL